MDGEDIEQKEILHLILWQSEKEKEIEQRRGGKGRPPFTNPISSIQRKKTDVNNRKRNPFLA